METKNKLSFFLLVLIKNANYKSEQNDKIT
jgi:hypothetical protein